MALAVALLLSILPASPALPSGFCLPASDLARSPSSATLPSALRFLPSDISSPSLPPGFARLTPFRSGSLLSSPLNPRTLEPLNPLLDSSLLVGDFPDTLETVVISGPYSHTGDIKVVNHGTLILDHADFLLRGNIEVHNSGTLRIQGGRFAVGQQFAYEFTSGVTGAGRIQFDSAGADFNGWSWSMLVTDSASFSVTNTVLRNGFATIVPVGRGTVEYSHADFSSEFVIFDSCRVSLANCDTILPWLNFPDGSTASLTLDEPDTTILHWELNSSTPGVTGINYSLTLDTVSSVLWGCFPLPGSDVTFRDSRLRTTGLIIPGDDSVTFNGLLNNQHHADYTLPLADRSYRLINTDLTTWNLYPGGSTNLVLNSCVFGEILTQDSSRATVQNSICDGSGGYIGSESQSTLLFLGCLVTTQVVSRDRSIMLGGLSTVMYGPVTSTDASTMLLLFCTTEREPLARDTSLLYLCDYRIPGSATVDDSLALVGTADIRPGPHNPLAFGSYRMSYAHADSQTIWHDIGMRHFSPVQNDTLEIWNTHGLLPGTYVLKMTLANSYGDSLEPVKAIYLSLASVAEQSSIYNLQSTISILPNPARSSSTIHLTPRILDPSSSATLSLFSSSGRRVFSAPCLPSSNFRLPSLPAGTYFATVTDGRTSATARFVVAR